MLRPALYMWYNNNLKMYVMILITIHTTDAASDLFHTFLYVRSQAVFVWS